MEEIILPIKDWEGEYSISNYGYVLTHKWGVTRKINGSIDTGGYNYYCLYRNNKRIMMWTHRIVALHFIENPNNERDVNHIDGNKLNNHISNLEWVNRRENVSHANNIRGDKDLPVGVCYRKDTKRYKAQYWMNNKNIIIGNYSTKEEAHEAYLKKLEEIGSKNRYSI